VLISGVFLHHLGAAKVWTVPYCKMWVSSWCWPAWQGLNVLSQRVRWPGRMEVHYPCCLMNGCRINVDGPRLKGLILLSMPFSKAAYIS